MSAWTLIVRSLRHYWRQNVAVVLGTVVGAAVVSGALLVGDSMRGSLRDQALRRLGRIESGVIGARYFSQSVAAALQASGSGRGSSGTAAGVLMLRGSAAQVGSGARDARVNIYGVDDHFAGLAGAEEFPRPTQDRAVVLSDSLARELGAVVGDDILLAPARQAVISPETLLGRRDQSTVSLRLTVQAITPAAGLGGLALDFRQAAAHNAFVRLETLQRALDQPGRINAVFLDAAAAEALRRGPGRLPMALEDYGVHVRAAPGGAHVTVESDSMLLPPPVETAVQQVADAFFTTRVTRMLTYLANEIRAIPAEARPAGGRPVPYSTVIAVDAHFSDVTPLTLLDGTPAPRLTRGEALLNRWTATELAAERGDEIELAYYVTLPFGRIEERSARFRVVGVLRMDTATTDSSLTPEYPGVTDAKSLADWDPPFPMDLKRIKPADEDYWTRYRTAPKVIVSLDDGRALWANDADRFGSLTSVRLRVADESPADVMARWAGEINRRLKPEAMGIRIEPLRFQALRAASGNTDFGVLFLAFSFFLLGSALLLVLLLFRLTIERRSEEVGLLAAIGVSRGAIRFSMLAQAGVLAAAGAALGQVAAVAYAWVMLSGLRSRWSAAVRAPFLELHANGLTVTIGFSISLAASLAAMYWGLRGLLHSPPRALLSGLVSGGGPKSTRRRLLLMTSGILSLAAGGLVLAGSTTRLVPAAGGFFGGGGLVLGAALCGVRACWAGPPRRVLRRPGWRTWIQLGVRNAPRHPGRSLLTVGLIASATFLIGALQAFRLEPPNATDRNSGSGGYALLAESAAPLLADLNAAEDRQGLGLSEQAQRLLASAHVAAMRLRPGDETSCLNLYRHERPRILGAPQSFLSRGGFSFAAKLPGSLEERANPWLLLNRRFDDGAVPVIGDEAAVRWQMHRDLGGELEISAETGEPRRLRFVALLAGSALQGELVVAEEAFTRLFPSISGYRFFLIDASPAFVAELEAQLERDLATQGFDAVPTQRRMAEYFAVQNTYLSTFQLLGAMGLLLGTVGLAVVMLRNVVERRGELALMRAVGFSRRALGTVVLSENAALLATGLIIGAAAAFVAVMPQVLNDIRRLSWTALLVTPLATLLAGLTAGVLALRLALRAPLMTALRRD